MYHKQSRIAGTDKNYLRLNKSALREKATTADVSIIEFDFSNRNNISSERPIL